MGRWFESSKANNKNIWGHSSVGRASVLHTVSEHSKKHKQDEKEIRVRVSTSCQAEGQGFKSPWLHFNFEDYPLCLISCRKGNLVASGFKSQVLDN